MKIDDERVGRKFWEKVHPEPNSGCWFWTGTVDRYGYGIVNRVINGEPRRTGAHRYILGTIEYLHPSLVVDHKCNNSLCVNPEHLRQVTPRENIMRGNALGAVNALKTHCPQGHEYTLDNTKIHRSKSTVNARACRTCIKASARRQTERRRDARKVAK